jgi:hypothetical protein
MPVTGANAIPLGTPRSPGLRSFVSSYGQPSEIDALVSAAAAQIGTSSASAPSIIRVDINSIPHSHRAILTRSAVADAIAARTPGASCICKGSYIAPGAPRDASSQPLCIEIAAPSLAAAQACEIVVRDIAENGDRGRYASVVSDAIASLPVRPTVREILGGPVPERRAPRIGKVYLDWADEAEFQGFRVTSRVLGRGGANVKWIGHKCHLKVSLRGRNTRAAQSRESADEPMHLFIFANADDPRSERHLARATRYCEDLAAIVRAEWDQDVQLARDRQAHDAFRQQGQGPEAYRQPQFRQAPGPNVASWGEPAFPAAPASVPPVRHALQSPGMPQFRSAGTPRPYPTPEPATKRPNVASVPSWGMTAAPPAIAVAVPSWASEPPSIPTPPAPEMVDIQQQQAPAAPDEEDEAARLAAWAALTDEERAAYIAEYEALS